MTTKTYDEREITLYLLGSLSEEETARFDELGFTDDEFAEALRVVEKDLVDAYARGELSGPTLERFKSFYLASPLRREKVRFAQALQTSAQKEPAPQTAVPTAPAGRAWWFSIFDFFAAPRPVWGWAGAAAAALVLLLLGGWLALENRRLRGERADQAPPQENELRQRAEELQTQLAAERAAHSEAENELARAREELARLEAGREKPRVTNVPRRSAAVASFLLTPPMRGLGQMPVVSVPAGAERVMIRLELESNDYRAYRVALLQDADRRVVWRSGPLKTRSGKRFLAVSLRANQLRPQIYALEVSGVSGQGGDEAIGGYPFRVVKQ